MKIIFMTIAVSMLALSSAGAANDSRCIYPNIEKQICCLDNFNFDVHDGNVIFRPKHDGHEKIKITDDYRLFVNGREYELNAEDKELVKEMHGLATGIEKEARKIGREGAKIGAAGAKLGLEALASVVKLLRSDYDSRDLEREMEEKAAKLESRAAELEKKARKLEDMADELDKLEMKLEQRIPELREKERI